MRTACFKFFFRQRSSVYMFQLRQLQSQLHYSAHELRGWFYFFIRLWTRSCFRPPQRINPLELKSEIRKMQKSEIQWKSEKSKSKSGTREFSAIQNRKNGKRSPKKIQRYVGCRRDPVTVCDSRAKAQGKVSGNRGNVDSSSTEAF